MPLKAKRLHVATLHNKLLEAGYQCLLPFSKNRADFCLDSCLRTWSLEMAVVAHRHIHQAL